MGVLITKILGTPDFGPYMLAGDEYLLIHAGMRQDPNGLKEILEALGVERPIFYEPRREVGNDQGIVFPYVAPESEVYRISNELEAMGVDLNIGILKTRYTALRNNVLVNNRGGIVNPRFYKEERDSIKALEDILDVELVPMSIAGLNLPGSIGVANDHGAFIHAEASTEEMESIRDILKVEHVVCGYINGSPYVSIGLVANNKGVVIGDETSPQDIMMVTEALLGRKRLVEI